MEIRTTAQLDINVRVTVSSRTRAATTGATVIGIIYGKSVTLRFDKRPELEFDFRSQPDGTWTGNDGSVYTLQAG